jgi:hypothetical protein
MAWPPALPQRSTRYRLTGTRFADYSESDSHFRIRAISSQYQRNKLWTQEKTIMKLWSDLLSTDYGILSAVVIGSALVIAVLTVRMFLRNIERDSQGAEG